MLTLLQDRLTLRIRTTGSEVKQVRLSLSTLMYCLGEEAEAVLSSTSIKEKERMVYETVLHKFELFFQVRIASYFGRSLRIPDAYLQTSVNFPRTRSLKCMK